MAALCAAISARRAGARVTLAEAAPLHARGGNTRHSRNLRIRHDAPSPLFPGTYVRKEFRADLDKAAKGDGDPRLTDLLIEHSATLPAWLAEQGVVFQTEGIPLSRRTAFFLGGGMAALNALYATAERLGVRVILGHPIRSLPLDALPADAVVVCSGGHQADLRHGHINRGTPYATGDLLRALLDQGVSAVGREGAAHLVAVDARSPVHDGGIVTRVDGFWLGMVVNAAGQRVLDEPSTTDQTRYSTWGRLVADQPGGMATLVLDADGKTAAPPSIFPPITAPRLEDLAALLKIDRTNLARSARDCGRVTRPPFFAYPIRPGVTFTCLGVKVDEKARVVMTNGASRPDLFAAGMIMAPNVLGTGYLAGGGLTIGAVFGRLAGEGAARYVQT
jgi:tricarballylate dehydrogenase